MREHVTGKLYDPFLAPSGDSRTGPRPSIKEHLSVNKKQDKLMGETAGTNQP